MGDTTETDLPFVGEPDTDGKLGAFCNSLRMEAGPVRSVYINNHPACLSMYLFGTDTPTDDTGMNNVHVYNKTQGMIETFLDQATRTEPIRTITPVTVMDAIPDQTLPPLMGLNGLPVMTPMTVTSQKGEIKLVDSQMLAEWMQTVFDAKEDKARFPNWFSEMVRQTLIYGTKQSLVDWDSDKKIVILKPFPAMQWWNDPTEPDIEMQTYVGLDWPIDAQRAKRLYPNLTAVIDKNAQRQVYMPAGNMGISQVYQGISYARPLVTMSTFYLRNRAMLMTSNEAVKAGKIRLDAVPVEAPDVDPANSQLSGTSPDSVEGIGGGDAGIAQAGGEGGAPDVAGDGGLPPESREVMLHAQTGEEIDPTHPNWPVKYVTSRVTCIVDVVVSEEVSDCYDGIPVVVNYNVQIPDRPFGQGEPVRVWSMQNDLNTVHGAMVDHSEWFKGPMGAMTNSMRDALPDDAKDAPARPGRIFYVDDLTWKENNGKMFEFHDPPALPPAMVTVRDGLIEGFNSVGGNPDSQQGITPTSNASGELVQSLQAAASASTNARMKYIKEMLYREAMISLGYYLRMSAEDWYEYNRTYDLATTGKLLEIARTLKWKFAIEVANGAAKAQKEAMVRQDAQTGLLDPETARDMLGYDHAEINNRQMAQAAVAGAQNGEAPTASSESPGAARREPSMPSRAA